MINAVGLWGQNLLQHAVYRLFSLVVSRALHIRLHSTQSAIALQRSRNAVPLLTTAGMADQIDTSKTEYQHVSTSEPDASQSSDSNITNALEQQPRTNTTRPLITTFALQVLTLLWLVPIAALVWLNVSEHKIGASVWCPNGDCYRSVRTRPFEGSTRPRI